MNATTLTWQTLLLACLKNPEHIKTLSPTEWSELLRLLKTSKLVAHFGWLVADHQLNPYVPDKVTGHFQAAQAIVDYRKRIALWELNRLQRALDGFNTDLIVLKGCAYLLACIPFASARLFSDVDILASKDLIVPMEQQLLTQHWRSLKLDEYDQNYYRRWMHEIPPLRHIGRNMEVDLHHTIIPPTSDLHPDVDLLIAGAVASGRKGLKILNPYDLTLHSAVHLFFDSDLGNKLRDLVDLDQLLKYFSSLEPDFYKKLLQRAQQLGLQRPLYYTLRYSQQLLGTPVPADIDRSSQTFAPSLPIKWLMDQLVPIAILPEHPDAPCKLTACARWLLFVRSHYLRMPMRLLIPHLARKSIRRLIPEQDLH